MAQSEPSIAQGQPTPTARTGTDSGAAGEATTTVIVRAPEPGERIEIEITSKIALRIAVDFTDAHAEVVDGKIEVTLPNGSVLVLYGEAVEQFLAGYAEMLEEALAPAAGWSEVQRILVPLEPIAPPRPDDMEDEEDSLDTESDAARALGPMHGTDNDHPFDIALAQTGTRSDDFVTLQEGPINHAPVATDDSYSIDEDTALIIGLPGVLANDSDGDDDALSASLVSGPAHGGLAFNADGSFTYNPDADYAGADSFTYKVTDGAGHVTSATVNLTVVAVADAPDLKVEDASGGEDTAIALSIQPALNDTDGSESLSVEIGGIPIGATLSDGTHSFTATSGSTSVDVTGWMLADLTITPPADSDAGFTLSVTTVSTEASNGDMATTKADLEVTVDAVADAPTLSIVDGSGDEDTAIALSIDPALTDADGSEALSLQVAGIPVGATLSDGSNSFTATVGDTKADISGWDLSSLSISPPANSDADFTLTVTATSTEASNGDEATIKGNLSVSVSSVADAPALTVADASGDEDTAIALSIDPALVDTDGSAVSTTSSSGPVNCSSIRPIERPSHGTMTRAVARSIVSTSGSSRSTRRTNTPPG